MIIVAGTFINLYTSQRHLKTSQVALIDTALTQPLRRVILNDNVSLDRAMRDSEGGGVPNG